jgi:hypothetical protein
MALQTLRQPHQSAPALAGTWKLAAGRAITLRPREAGHVKIVHGSAWVTFDGPHQGALNDFGDHVLNAGERLRLRRGQRLVMETGESGQPAYFSWDVLAEGERRPAPAAALAQPVEDLRLAAVLGASAAGRLLAALAGLAWGWTRRARPSLADCAFSAHSRA